MADIPEPASFSKPSALLGLPLELLYGILAEDVLTKKDLKNLRLADRTLARILTPILFREVKITLAQQDDSYEPYDSQNIYENLISDSEDSTEKKQNSVVDPILDLAKEESNHKALLEARMRAIKDRSYSQSFFDAVTYFVIDASKIYQRIDDQARNLVKNWLTAKDLVSRFPKLATLTIKTSAQGQSEVAAKLIKWALRSTIDGVELHLNLTNVDTHRTCMRPIKNTARLEVQALARQRDVFCKDLNDAITRSQSLTHLHLDIGHEYDYHYSDDPTNLKAIFENIANEKLRDLKSLHLGFNVQSTEVAHVAKLVALEKLSVTNWTEPNKTYTKYTWSEVHAPNTIWDHLGMIAIKLRTVKVGKCDITLLKYLTSFGDHLEHLSILPTPLHVWSGDSPAKTDTLKDFNHAFWYEVFPRIVGTLRSLTVVARGFIEDLDESYPMPLGIPLRDDTIQQLLADSKLEEVEIGLAHRVEEYSLNSVLSLFRPIATLKRLSIHLCLTTISCSPQVYHYYNQQGVYDWAKVDRERYRHVKHWREIVADEIQIPSQDHGGSTTLRRGVILEVLIYFKSAPAPRAALKYVSRGTHWHRLPNPSQKDQRRI